MGIQMHWMDNEVKEKKNCCWYKSLAKEANVTVMNEAGLDPGIDHMLAMQCFDQISDHGGKVTSFVSFCGGLPAPESSDNPLRYKFSWSPKGVLMALMNGARYLDNERLIEVEGDCAVLDNLYPICFMPGFNLIGYPNRDSIKYATIYGLGPECKTLLRGTLRYKVGFSFAHLNTPMSLDYGCDILCSNSISVIFMYLSDSFAAPSGCLVCSIDNMPAQMPYEATEAFGNLLYPYIIDMLNCSTDQPFDHLHCSEDIKRAIITNAGSLTPRYEYITELRLKRAKEANVTVMNEAGLDPGIDHMLAMQCFDQISDHGGKVTSFVSFCGGLPAPESSDNPLRYKFSWSPKGVLMALMNGARYLDNERLIEVEGDCAVLDNLYPICFMPGFNLIGYPNRDSIKYATIYGLGPECKTLLRGTLRYKGFVEAVKALKELGLMNMEPNAIFNSATGPDLSWKQILASLLHQPTDIFAESLKKIAAEKLGKEKSIEMNAIVELGLLSEDVVERHGTALDTLAAYLARKLALHKSERDLVILNHDVDAQLPGGMQERHRIQLVAYGQPNGFSAMASTVGYTTAIISHMLLNGEIQDKGMVRPTSKHVYRPALQRLKDYGIEATETITAL
ncbi:Alpha-aminoadipic semialdehyde synthase, mitochondrial [Toxocara canis]|uniref:Alpha-aminoadipic semialdehyde synthase, mitochondrial n=1 Tax=Toxocara canis TaxID=6265 RepID=A0A0B2V1Y3_TOXCA|nr:Alpha-aminoadipic semialdehyde synthase, mitochondrial [Toxocara canis]